MKGASLPALFTLGTVLGGCVKTLDVSLQNQANQPVHVELRDHWDGGNDVVWISGTVAPGGRFGYTTYDRERSERKSIWVRYAASTAEQDWRSAEIGSWFGDHFVMRSAANDASLILVPE